jgi:carbon-monoxide dehydrogenase large subunit
VVDPVAVRQPSASRLFETAPDSLALTATQGNTAATDEAFEAAAETVNLDVNNDRLIANAIEPRAPWPAGPPPTRSSPSG